MGFLTCVFVFKRVYANTSQKSRRGINCPIKWSYSCVQTGFAQYCRHSQRKLQCSCEVVKQQSLVGAVSSKPKKILHKIKYGT